MNESVTAEAALDVSGPSWFKDLDSCPLLLGPSGHVSAVIFLRRNDRVGPRRSSPFLGGSIFSGLRLTQNQDTCMITTQLNRDIEIVRWEGFVMGGAVSSAARMSVL